MWCGVAGQGHRGTDWHGQAGRGMVWKGAEWRGLDSGAGLSRPRFTSEPRADSDGQLVHTAIAHLVLV